MASLLVISGPTSGDYFLLGQEPVVIGRDEVSPIQIVDEAVSRRHVRIGREAEAETYLLEDMGSANGTYLNDMRVEQARRLSDGDVVRLGSTELMFSAVDFADGETAFQHYRQRGEHEKSTIIRKRV